MLFLFLIYYSSMLFLLVKFLFILLFYRQFRHCITALQATRASGKAHTPKEERAHPKALPVGELSR
jgi:hypothetical protein